MPGKGYHLATWFRLAPALLGLLVFVLVGAASLAALLRFSQFESWAGYLHNIYLWRVVRFSLWQALLSSVLSLLIAVPVASCLTHRQFKGRGVLLQLFAVSMVVPTIVAILGIVVVYGHSGWLHALFGVETPLYGLLGILLAHVFFNMPLAVRLLLQSYGLVPSGQWRLASQLGFSRWTAFRLIEWSYIKKALPGAFVLIFMLCFSSFSVVLSLGGGPKSSTLEVAIYQALRFDFDLNKASFLSLLQVSICSLVALMVYRFAPANQQDVSLLDARLYPLKDSIVARSGDCLAMALAVFLVIPPFLAIFDPIFSITFYQTLMAEATWQAVWVSLKIAIPAGLLSLFLGGCFGVLARTAMDRGRLAFLSSKIEQLGSMILMVPGLVLATGLFLWLRSIGLSPQSGYWVVVWVNAVMALPFVLRALMPVLYQQEKRFRNLYTSLGIHGANRLVIEWPLIRKSVSQAFGYAVLLSLGDMGVIALFGSQGLVSLPLYLFQLIGSYRLQEGSCIAVILICLCLLLFYLSVRFIGGKTHVKY
ncbi:Sulfate transport system permease protein CysW [Marinomonas spartinae]|uniref:Thiamine transport system permease protein ThiP n=1 Tax=Marinomonas spartinae TaxID=1792290 RepID=A0A1A8T8W5_9GAMM|nr:thiamine/thiamine pyrophosphate ABC transporter permease [Marinomonas spartinae]SBS28248.1 Sulfate transport system permease protein CysW [Marinomonas spartinae]SBS28364.1 Sulfate transport system permease protein CysW [Marinomonas spartinae]